MISLKVWRCIEESWQVAVQCTEIVDPYAQTKINGNQTKGMQRTITANKYAYTNLLKAISTGPWRNKGQEPNATNYYPSHSYLLWQQQLPQK